MTEQTKNINNSVEAKPLLSLNNVSVTLGSQKILRDISAHINQNDWMMIIGPNGAGKSTLIRAISQSIDYSGDVVLFGENAINYSKLDFAKHVGFLSQKNSVGFDFTVSEIIQMGRYAHQKSRFGVKPLTSTDQKLIDKATQDCGLFNLLDKPVSKISGGELQRAFLAQVFAQNPDILILDEPTNHLDLKYQDEIFSIIDKWRKLPGHAVISVVHDLTIAKKYATTALLLSKGSQLSFGLPGKVMSNKNLSEAYLIDVEHYMSDLMSVWN